MDVGPSSRTVEKGHFPWSNFMVHTYDRGEPTASVLSADGFPLMAGPNFQPSDGNSTIISIPRQLADGLENDMEI